MVITPEKKSKTVKIEINFSEYTGSLKLSIKSNESFSSQIIPVLPKLSKKEIIADYIEFCFDDLKIDPDCTPDFIGMSDGDVLDANYKPPKYSDDSSEEFVALESELSHGGKIPIKLYVDKNTTYSVRLLPTDPLKKVIDYLVKKLGTKEGNIVLVFDGERLNAAKTLNFYDIEEEDQIDIVLKK
eukprot:TRINITY_DN5546_c0_g1_i2.p1 TRINITY_DN5546_c0_g1~~TRINITY_DN5546_c0_g1_i2.p1  ORF type:complete len:185 (+),score=47.93 TRINITY_DN5546_c0_g1_i2:572-1126(+)